MTRRTVGESDRGASWPAGPASAPEHVACAVPTDAEAARGRTGCLMPCPCAASPPNRVWPLADAAARNCRSWSSWRSPPERHRPQRPTCAADVGASAQLRLELGCCDKCPGRGQASIAGGDRVEDFGGMRRSGWAARSETCRCGWAVRHARPATTGLSWLRSPDWQRVDDAEASPRPNGRTRDVACRAFGKRHGRAGSTAILAPPRRACPVCVRSQSPNLSCIRWHRNVLRALEEMVMRIGLAA